MKNRTYTRQTIDEIIVSKEIAIAGVSRNPKKFGYIVYKTLKEKGYTVYPVNPIQKTLMVRKVISQFLAFLLR